MPPPLHCSISPAHNTQAHTSPSCSRLTKLTPWCLRHQAVQSLDETINDIFGDNHDVNNNDNKAKASSSGGTRDGWVELRGGTAKSASALLHPEEAARDTAAAAAAAAAGDEHLASSSGRKMPAAGGPRAGVGGYPGAFVMGGRRGGAKGRGRVFGVPLEDLVLNPER